MPPIQGLFGQRVDREIAIADIARASMTAFPDLRVSMDELSIKTVALSTTGRRPARAPGLGGSGRAACIGGFQLWQMSADGLIAWSVGQFDSHEYQRQLSSAGLRASQTRSTSDLLIDYRSRVRVSPGSGFHLLQSSQQFSAARRGHLATCSTGCGLIKQLRIHLRIQAHFRKGDDT